MLSENFIDLIIFLSTWEEAEGDKLKSGVNHIGGDGSANESLMLVSSCSLIIDLWWLSGTWKHQIKQVFPGSLAPTWDREAEFLSN